VLLGICPNALGRCPKQLNRLRGGSAFNSLALGSISVILSNCFIAWHFPQCTWTGLSNFAVSVIVQRFAKRTLVNV